MWYFKKFEELSSKEFHQIAKERIKVFVVEQTSAYQEVDDIDLTAVHIFKKENNQLKAYARLFEKEGKLSFGRVLVPEEGRGEGSGRALLEKILTYAKDNYSDWDIEIQAEAYLKEFYGSFGFEVISDLYFDFDIGHYDMVLTS